MKLGGSGFAIAVQWGSCSECTSQRQNSPCRSRYSSPTLIIVGGGGLFLHKFRSNTACYEGLIHHWNKQPWSVHPSIHPSIHLFFIYTHTQIIYRFFKIIFNNFYKQVLILICVYLPQWLACYYCSHWNALLSYELTGLYFSYCSTVKWVLRKNDELIKKLHLWRNIK